MLTAALLGFALGIRHAFDPDHVAAISTIVARDRDPRRAAWIAISWGLGHTATILCAGALVIGLRLAISPSLALAVEVPVGLLLVALGAANLLAARRGGAQARSGGSSLHGAVGRAGLIGLAHGLAGTAAIALLALAAMPTPLSAFAYLAVFGLGTVAGMVIFSVAMSAPFARLPAGGGAQRLVTAATGLVSLLVGSWMLYQLSASGLEALA